MEEETEKFEKEKKIVNLFLKKFTWLIGILMIFVIWINIHIRTLPMKINPNTGVPYLWDITRDNWTLGPDLDPFFFLRWAKIIVEQGALPIIDYMRYVPLGYNTYDSTTLLPGLIAYLYKFLHFFTDKVTIEYAAVIFPVIASVLTVIGFFFLVRKIFEFKGKKISNLIALVASVFLVTLPSLLSRTIAGIPEKESIAFALMFFAFYFFLCSWKSDKIWKIISLGILAGFFTGMMALIWGGVLFIYVTLAIAGFVAFIIGSIDNKKLITYSSWIISSALFWIPFTSRYSWVEFLTSSSTGLALLVLVFIVVFLVISKTKLENYFKSRKLLKPIIVIIISLFLVFIVSAIFISPQVIPNIAKNMIKDISSPYSDRLSFTVAENKQPYFSDWRYNFGPSVGNIPLFFWLFFIGSVVLFYEMVKGLKKKDSILLTVGFVLFLLAIIFSNFSATSILNGNSGFSLLIYFSGFLLLIGLFGYVLYKEKGDLGNILFEYLFVFSLVLVGIIAGRSGIRLIMLLAPIAVIPLSYFIVTQISNMFKKKKDALASILVITLGIIILIASAYTLFYNYKVSESSAMAQVPNSYTYQWQEAMGWVRENTSQDAVFAHWWDYGYWVQTMGERATVLDGGNSVSYWNYLMGRHVLTGQSENEALEFLWNHNVTHFLIDSSDVGKYGAYSNIGSDENYDRYSWIGEFVLDETQTLETSNSTNYAYLGGVVLDEDIVIEGKILPSQKSGIGAMIVPVDENNTIQQPYAIAVYNNQQFKLDLRYAYYKGNLIDFGSGIEGCAFIYPRVILEGGNQVRVDERGAAFYLSPKNMNALWVRLYLLGEGENFKVVHKEQSELIIQLEQQGINVGDFVYYNTFYGPITIWEVEYTGEEVFNEEYIQKTYPDYIKDRKYV